MEVTFAPKLKELKENETLHFFLIKIKMQLISQLSVLGEQLATCRRRLWAGRQQVFASKTLKKNVVYFFLTLSGSSSLLPTKLAAGRFLVYRLVNGVNHCKPLAIWSLETHGSADGFLLPYYLFSSHFQYSCELDVTNISKCPRCWCQSAGL